ncbi:MAG TPA: hypothetical protein VF235_02810 [Actinomycetota bacterium]
MARLRPFLVASVAVLALAACGEGGTSPSEVATSTEAGPLDPAGFAAQVASTDLYVEAPQRVQVGVFASDPEQGVLLVTGGTVAVRLVPGEGGTGTPVEGTATYVAAPGTPEGAEPSLTAPSEARGVYQLSDVTFDAAGVWQAEVTATLADGTVTVGSAFAVLEEPALPAPGQLAIGSENLTLGSKGVDPVAIDSRAQDGQEIPDPQLHRDTIAQAMDDGRPIVALFATPVYCQSQFCGPTVDALEVLEEAGPKDAVYIHVEIWNDYQASAVNAAAAEWLLRNEDLTEPWLFLIDADGTIVDRWGPLFDVDEVMAELQAVAG